MANATTTESYESFTTEELEGALSFGPEDMEEIETALEEEAVEDIEEFEGVGEGASQEAVPLVLLGKFAGKYLLRAMIKLALRLITRIASNAALKKKVQDAVSKGGRPAFCRLMCQAVCKILPPVVRPLCNRFCPLVCAKVAPIAARKLNIAI
jgi:hypothetical protein